jgi:RNA polymerase sigma factor (sigma-70 family)
VSDEPKASVDAAAKNELLQKALAMVRRLARRLCGRHPDGDYDDLVQIGSEVAMKLIDQYDPALNDSFEGYAWLRVRGAMKDRLRRKPLPAIEPWRAAMERAAGEIAEALHDEGDVLKDTDATTQGHIDAAAGGIAAGMAFAFFERERAARPTGVEAFLAREEYVSTMGALDEAFALLSEYHARIIDLRWRENLDFDAIARTLNVSSPTAHRHHAQAFKRLGSLLHARGVDRAPPLDGRFEQPGW